MLSTRFNTTNLGALGPILTTLLVGADEHWAWGMGTVWMTAMASLVMWVLLAFTPDAGYTYKPQAQNPNLKMVVWLPLLLMALVALSACSPLIPYYSQVKGIADKAALDTVTERKDFNDKKAIVSISLVCDMSLGAYFRLENQDQKDALATLCGGESQGITADRLAQLMKALDAMKGGTP